MVVDDHLGTFPCFPYYLTHLYIFVSENTEGGRMKPVEVSSGSVYITYYVDGGL